MARRRVSDARLPWQRISPLPARKRTSCKPSSIFGLVPDGGSTWLLARAIGRARATRMMMLGEKISAEQAEDWGLIYKAVEADDLMAEARALGEKLANGPTLRYQDYEGEYQPRAGW